MSRQTEPGRRLAAAAAGALVLWSAAITFTTAGAELLLGAAALLRVLALAAGDRPVPFWRAGPTTRWVPPLLLLFVGLYLVSAAAGEDRAAAARKLPTLFRYAVFLVAVSSAYGDVFWRWLLRAQAGVGLVIAVQAVISRLQGWDRAQTPNLHYNTLAQVAGLISLLLLAAALYGPAARRRERIFLAVGAAAATLALLLTLSRAAWIGWLTGAILLLLTRLRWRMLVPALLMLVAVPVALLPDVRDRALEMGDIQDPEFTRRYDLWRMARAVIADHPWTGLGPGGMDAAYDRYKTGVLVPDPQRWLHVHNDLLEIALLHGVPAALVWIALLAACYVAAWRRLRRFAALPGSWAKGGFAGAALGLHLFTVCGVLHDNYVIYLKMNLLLLLLGLLVAADRALPWDGSDGAAEPAPAPRGPA